MGSGKDGAWDGVTKNINQTPNLSLVTPSLAVFIPGPPWPCFLGAGAALRLPPASVHRPLLKFSLKPQLVHCVSLGKWAVARSTKYKMLGAARKSNLCAGEGGEGRKSRNKTNTEKSVMNRGRTCSSRCQSHAH